jgi:hypothetical protein
MSPRRSVVVVVYHDQKIRPSSREFLEQNEGRLLDRRTAVMKMKSMRRVDDPNSPFAPQSAKRKPSQERRNGCVNMHKVILAAAHNLFHLMD